MTVQGDEPMVTMLLAGIGSKPEPSIRILDDPNNPVETSLLSNSSKLETLLINKGSSVL